MKRITWPTGNPVPEHLNRLAIEIEKSWADKGMLLEGGWRAFEHLCLAETSEIQRREMRKAWMLGAQHLFASIIGIMDPGEQETDADLRRMDLIQKELEAFRRSLGN